MEKDAAHNVMVYQKDEPHMGVVPSDVSEEQANTIICQLVNTMRAELMGRSLTDEHFEWSPRVENWIHREKLTTVGSLYRQKLNPRNIGCLSAVEIITALGEIGLSAPRWAQRIVQKRATA